MIPIAHQFNNNAIEKSVCVFVSDPTMQQQALDAGAKLAGGEDLISDMVKGRIELADFDRFLCHDELGIHMRSVTGLLREKTPNKLDGTLGSDMLKMIRTFRTGISVEVKKVKKTLGIDDDPSYGFCEVGRRQAECTSLIWLVA
jgi:ribosomal protein L1